MANLIPVSIPNTPFTFHFHPIWHAWLTEKNVLGKSFVRHMQRLWEDMDVDGEEMLPHHSRWFAAFEDDPTKIRVVIVGQDPYPTSGRATGYSFEIAGGAEDSLRTIFNAIRSKGQYPDARIDYDNGDLSHWREQGVLLLNKALSVCGYREREVTVDGVKVREDQPKSCFIRWQYFTKGAMRVLCEKRPFLVFVLWGRHAAKLSYQITAPIKKPHAVVRSYHPSDLAKTVNNPAKPVLPLFSDVPHFTRVNKLLAEGPEGHLPPIDWSTLPPP